MHWFRDIDVQPSSLRRKQWRAFSEEALNLNTPLPEFCPDGAIHYWNNMDGRARLTGHRITRRGTPQYRVYLARSLKDLGLTKGWWCVQAGRTDSG